jgi:hypothetical protein
MPNIEKEPLLLPDFKKYHPKYLKKTFTTQKWDEISTKPQQEKFEYFYIL